MNKDRPEAPPNDLHTTKREVLLDNLKTNINNLVWTSVPDTLTMIESDQLACEIYALIMKRWDAIT